MMSRMSSSVPRAGEAQASAVTSRVRTAAWFLLVLLGLIETVYGRHAIQDDGISYLDMGDAIARADWKMALNGVWSPLYPFLQGVTLRLLKPSEYLQFTVVHCVNFLIFLFALRMFRLLIAGGRDRAASTGWCCRRQKLVAEMGRIRCRLLRLPLVISQLNHFAISGSGLAHGRISLPCCGIAGSASVPP